MTSQNKMRSPPEKNNIQQYLSPIRKSPSTSMSSSSSTSSSVDTPLKNDDNHERTIIDDTSQTTQSSTQSSPSMQPTHSECDISMHLQSHLQRDVMMIHDADDPNDISVDFGISSTPAPKNRKRLKKAKDTDSQPLSVIPFIFTSLPRCNPSCRCSGRGP